MSDIVLYSHVCSYTRRGYWSSYSFVHFGCLHFVRMHLESTAATLIRQASGSDTDSSCAAMMVERGSIVQRANSSSTSITPVFEKHLRGAIWFLRLAHDEQVCVFVLHLCRCCMFCILGMISVHAALTFAYFLHVCVQAELSFYKKPAAAARTF